MQFLIQLFVLLILAVALCSGGGCIGKDSSESTNKNTTNYNARSGSFKVEESSIYYDAHDGSFNANRNLNSIYNDAQNGGSFNANRSPRKYYDAPNGDSFNASSSKFEKEDLKNKEYDKEAQDYYTRKTSKRKN